MADYMLPLSRKKTRRDYDPLPGMLVDWYGKEEAANEIISRLPRSEHIKESLDDALKTLLPAHIAVLQKIKRHWNEIAGPQLAKYMEPVNIYKKTLLIEVSHPAWLMEFKDREQKMLLEKIRCSMGEDVCDRIRLTPVGARKR